MVVRVWPDNNKVQGMVHKNEWLLQVRQSEDGDNNKDFARAAAAMVKMIVTNESIGR